MPNTAEIIPLRPNNAGNERRERVAELRHMLELMKHPTTAETLQILREAFPDIPLKDRVAALTERRG